MAHVVERKRRGRVELWIQWRDWDAGKYRWASCRRTGADSSKAKMKAMLEDYQEREDAGRRRHEQYGGRPRYDTLVSHLADEWLAEIEAQVAAREARGGRAGKARGTWVGYKTTLERWKRYVGAEAATGDMTPETVRGWKASMQAELTPQGVNYHLRQLRVWLHRYDDASPPFFRYRAVDFRRAFAAVPEDRQLPVVLSPDQLEALLPQLEERGLGRLALLLLLTGCRLGEALALTWADVNTAAGIVRISAGKTGRVRLVVLEGDPSGDVSPLLLERLRAWRGEPDELVAGLARFPRDAWNAARKAAEVEPGTPKACRSTWVSYMLALGRPTAVVSQMAGHGVAVLERHYLAWAGERRAGASVCEAMGLG